MDTGTHLAQIASLHFGITIIADAGAELPGKPASSHQEREAGQKEEHSALWRQAAQSRV